MEKIEFIEKLENLKSQFLALKPKLKLDEKKIELENLAIQTQSPSFWEYPANAKIVSQKMARIEDFLRTWKTLETNIKDLKSLLEIANETESSEFEAEILACEKNFKTAETKLLLSEKHDENNAILTLHTGNGGQDAEDFCQMLLRMYLRFCEQKEFKINILDESITEDGIKSATIEIKGHFAYGLLKSEHGVHRLIRLSPFNAKNLRQTSFARIEILPEIEDTNEIQIEEKDLRIDVFRSSGSGGQGVNTTDSAVRITYLPLNLAVTCQNERSQHQNKDSALKVLRSKLAQLKIEQKTQALQELRGDFMENSFGSQIRTYTLHPYKLVKDHRTNYEETNPERVLDGDLEGFINAFLSK